MINRRNRPIERTSGMTQCDSLFRYICLIVGVHTANKSKNWIRYFCFSTWLLIHVIGILVYANFVGGRLGHPASFSSFTIIARGIILASADLISFVQLFVMHNDIEPMLQTNERQFKDFSVHFICSAVIVPKYIRLWSHGSRSAVLKTYFLLLEAFMAMFLIIYNDILIHSQKTQANILELARNLESNSQKILNEKWRLRRRIERVNRLFAWILGLYHLRIFMSGVQAVRDFLGREKSTAHIIWIMLEQIAMMVQLFDIAMKASALQRSSLEIEKHFPSGIRRDTQRRLNEILLALQFHEDLDTLRNGCYSLGSGKFLSFLMTSFTCAAVVLQFDFQVVRTLTTLGELA